MDLHRLQHLNNAPMKPWGVFASVLICALALGSCARKQPETVSAQRHTAKVEHPGKNTRVTITGPGGEHVLEIKPAEVMRHIGLPVFPGATPVAHSQHLALATDTGHKTYSARFRTPSGFDQVVNWYKSRMKTDSISSKIVGTRRALIAKTDWKDGRVHTVFVNRSTEGKTTNITLMLVIEKH